MRRYVAFCSIASILFTVLFIELTIAQPSRNLIIASTNDLADIAQSVAGKGYEVISVMRDGGNPALLIPSQVTVFRAKKAEVYLNFGNGLENIWEKEFFKQAHCPQIAPDTQNYHSVTAGITLLPLKPSKSATKSALSYSGNPYVWLDPENSKKIARNIARILSNHYPSDTAVFNSNVERYIKKIDPYIKRIKKRMAPYAGMNIFAYDHSFDYFTSRFNIKIIDYIVPAQSIVPTQKRIQLIADKMASRKISVLLIPEYQNNRIVARLAKHTAIQAIALPVCSGKGWATDYITLLNRFTQLITDGLSKSNNTVRK